MKNMFPILVFMASIFTSTKLSIAHWVQTPVPEGGIVNCFAMSDTNLFAGPLPDGIFLCTDKGAPFILYRCFANGSVTPLAHPMQLSNYHKNNVQGGML